MSRILGTFCSTDRPMASCIWRGCLLGIIPIVVLEWCVLPQTVTLIAYFVLEPRMLPMPWLLAAIIIVPWVEALLMWPVLWVLKEVVQDELCVASIFAVTWSVLHALIMAHGFYIGTGVIGG